jgi:ribosomal protein S18 acetylase RimI-like enzyme
VSGHFFPLIGAEVCMQSWHLLPMEIAPLPPDLHGAAVALWRDVGLTRPWNDPDSDLRRALDGAASEVLGGVEAGQLVATAMVGHDGHRGWVYYVAVRPDVRGRGHGRQMMRACEEWVAERGIEKLNLMVREDNDTARGFYRAIGYSPDEVVVLSRRL